MAEITVVHLLRHGEVHNPNHVLYGRLPGYHLSANGRMMAAAPLIEGEHDFTAFAASDDKDEAGASKVRRIFSSRLSSEGDRLIYCVRGSGFLKHMVRNIAGVLIEVGKGNLSCADVEARLVAGCGIPAGPAMPARGLFLVSVEYY